MLILTGKVPPMARILIADDSSTLRTMMRQILERAGHQVSEAPDGEAAVRMCRKGPPDLFITELVMPEKDGIEAIIELHRDFPFLKIIAVSGDCTISPYINLKMASALGADRTLLKPFSRADFMEAVADVILPPSPPFSGPF